MICAAARRSCSVGAGALAALWGRYGHRVNLARFLQVTAVFLLLFVVQLAIYAFHELTEADILPLDNAYWHIATEPYGPEGEYGHWLSYALVAFPLGRRKLQRPWCILQPTGKQLPLAEQTFLGLCKSATSQWTL